MERREGLGSVQRSRGCQHWSQHHWWRRGGDKGDGSLAQAEGGLQTERLINFSGFSFSVDLWQFSVERFFPNNKVRLVILLCWHRLPSFGPSSPWVFSSGVENDGDGRYGSSLDVSFHHRTVLSKNYSGDKVSSNASTLLLTGLHSGFWIELGLVRTVISFRMISGTI